MLETFLASLAAGKVANDLFSADWSNGDPGGAIVLAGNFPSYDPPKRTIDKPTREPVLGEYISPFGTELNHPASSVQTVADIPNRTENTGDLTATTSSMLDLGAFEGYFGRGIIIILGFIFVAVGLRMLG